MLTEKIVSYLSKLTQEKPMFLHFDSLGLLYLGNSNESRLEAFSEMLNQIHDQGGNIIVPSFSYSFCRNEVFNIKDTPTTLGKSHDYLREKNFSKRSCNGIFSYLIFGSHPVFEKYMFNVKSDNCFGEPSLLSDIFELNGFIGSIGGVIHSTTEIHHIEKKLGVEYRFDKAFKGSVVHLNGDTITQEVTYFCRDLEFYRKTSLGSDLSRLYEDLHDCDKIKEANFENEFLIEYVPYVDVYEMADSGLKKDPHYLLSHRSDMFSGCPT